MGKESYKLLNGEIFDNMLEAKVLTEMLKKHYNNNRVHSSLNYWPLIPEVALSIFAIT